MRYLIRPAELAPYSPANHTGTRNLRLIGPETVGARQVEVVLGQLEQGRGALPHAHPGIGEVCCLREGEAHVEVGGETFEMRSGEVRCFPTAPPLVFKATSK